MKANGWPIKTISEIAKHSLGKMLDKNKNKGTPRPYLRNLNVRWFEFDLSDLLEMRFLDEEEPKFTAVKGDVLICEGGYPGRAAIWDSDEPIHFQKAIHRVRFHEPERNTWFVYYLHMLELSGKIKEYCTGTGILHFTGETLARLPIPLPPLPEQRRIVGILDEAFAAIATAKANTEKNLQNARDVFGSHLQAIISTGAPSRRLGDLVTRLTNGFVGPTRNIYCESGVPYLLARHVKDNRLTFDGKTFISDEFNRKHKKSMLKTGDVLLVQSGHIGHSAVVTKEHQGHNCHAMIVITPVETALLGKYLSLLFNSPTMRREFDAIRSGSTVPHLTCREVKEMLVPLPSLSVQMRAVEQAEKLSEATCGLTRLYERKLAALDALRKSMLHQAFSGQLTASID